MLRPSIFYSYLVLVPLTIFFGIVACLCAPIELFVWHRRYTKGKLGPSARLVRDNWSTFMLWAHSVKIQLEGPGAENLRKMRGCVFISNHQSAIDILVSIHILPKNSLFIAKKEILQVPIFGQAAWLSGVIYIDRAKGSQNRSLGATSRLLKAGASLIIYPEGTRSKDGNLLSFKRGAFAMAIDNQAPIVPITLLDTRTLCPKGKLSIAPGTVHVYVDNPISTVGMTHDDRFKLSDDMEALIRSRLAGNRDPVS